jgi:hypothetical protein
MSNEEILTPQVQAISQAFLSRMRADGLSRKQALLAATMSLAELAVMFGMSRADLLRVVGACFDDVSQALVES